MWVPILLLNTQGLTFSLTGIHMTISFFFRWATSTARSSPVSGSPATASSASGFERTLHKGVGGRGHAGPPAGAFGQAGANARTRRLPAPGAGQLGVHRRVHAGQVPRSGSSGTTSVGADQPVVG